MHLTEKADKAATEGNAPVPEGQNVSQHDDAKRSEDKKHNSIDSQARKERWDNTKKESGGIMNHQEDDDDDDSP